MTTFPPEKKGPPTRLFDIKSATEEEIIAEANRRWDERNGIHPMDRVPVKPRPRRSQATSCEFVIPFDLLISDNDRSQPVVSRLAGGRVYPRLVLNPRYKKAKAKIRTLVDGFLPAGWEPYEGRVSLSCTVHEPDRKRTRDLTNWAKLIGDALTGLAYGDDGQIDKVEWFRGAVDPAAPRLEVRVTLLA